MGIEAIFIALCILYSGIQIILCKYDLSSPFFAKGDPIRGDWAINHDERMCLFDARGWYLKRFDKRLYSPQDYLPYPVCAAFGIFVAIIDYLGFRLLGLNNRGLRLFCILLHLLSNVFVVLSLFKVASPLIASIAALVFLLNWNHFVFTMKPTPEGVFTVWLSGTLFLYLYYPEVYRSYWWLVAFLSASSILVKVNLPIIQLCLILCINIVALSFIETLEGIGLFVLGLIFFELLQLLVLWQMGVVKTRFYNLYMVSKVHTGREVRPIILGFSVFYVFVNVFLEWFCINKNPYDHKRPKGVIYPLTVLFLWVLLAIILQQSDSVLVSMPLFLVLSLLTVAPFLFCMKRFISLFPVAFIMIVAVIDLLVGMAGSWGYLIVTVLSIFAMIAIFRQIRLGQGCYAERSVKIAEICRYIDEKLQYGAHIYCHLFAFRASWQIKKHRLYVADDGVMVNQQVFDWAVNKGGGHLLLTTGGGGMSPERWSLLRPFTTKMVTNSDVDVKALVILYEFDI